MRISGSLQEVDEKRENGDLAEKKQQMQEKENEPREFKTNMARSRIWRNKTV